MFFHILLSNIICIKKHGRHKQPRVVYETRVSGERLRSNTSLKLRSVSCQSESYELASYRCVIAAAPGYPTSEST